jgi:hypothetical protein
MLASILATFAFSGIVTGISVIINNEPITLYEVYKYSKKYKISKKESLDILIRQKLEDAEIKKYRISTDLFEVNERVKRLAQQNNLSEYEFLNLLKSKNIKISKYKEDLKTKIKKEKLYRQILSSKISQVTAKDAKNFYKKNISQFKFASGFDVSIYIAKNRADLRAIKKNPMLRLQNVEVKEKSLVANNMDKKLVGLLNNTKEGSFTQILSIQNRPTMFYIKAKKGLRTIAYEKVKNNIYNVLSRKKEEKTINNYFEKIKASAAIKVLRSPS